jgi:hypothetical protein
MVLSNSDVKLQREPITILIMIEEILRFQIAQSIIKYHIENLFASVIAR